MAAEPKKLIYLEKFTPSAKQVIQGAQALADDMRHTQVTMLHVEAAAEAYVIADTLLLQSGIRTHASTLQDLFKEFMDLSERQARLLGTRSDRLQRLAPDAPSPMVACLNADVIRFLAFLEQFSGTEKVRLFTLFNELMCTMKTA